MASFTLALPGREYGPPRHISQPGQGQLRQCSLSVAPTAGQSIIFTLPPVRWRLQSIYFHLAASATGGSREVKIAIMTPSTTALVFSSGVVQSANDDWEYTYARGAQYVDQTAGFDRIVVPLPDIIIPPFWRIQIDGQLSGDTFWNPIILAEEFYE